MEEERVILYYIAKQQGLADTKKKLEELEKQTQKTAHTSRDLGKQSSDLKNKQDLLKSSAGHLAREQKEVTNILGKNTRILSQSVLETKKGLRITTSYTNGQRILTRTLDFTGEKMKEVATSTRMTGQELKNLAPLTEQFVLALKRVAIVLPVWFAARQVIMAFTQTIQEGIKYLYDFNKAFTKASLVVHTADSLSKVTEKLRKDFTVLAKEVGESGTEIAKAFYRFGTLGIEQTKAWAGASASIRQAIATYGDMDAIARANALAISLLGDTLERNLTIQEKMNLLAAKQVVLWRTNLLESTEFAGAIERFLPTAKIFNLTIDQTIALLASLHSAGIRSTRAGRLLSTSFLKFAENLDKVAENLGIIVKEGDDFFTSFTKVLSVLSEIYKETHGRLNPALNRLFKEIFGGIRSRQVANALVSLNDVLKKNFETINTMGGTAIDKMQKLNELFNEQYNVVIDSYSKLVDKMHQLRREIGEEFIKGFLKTLTGTTDERDAIKEVNKSLENILKTLKAIQKLAPEINALLKTIGALGALAGLSKVFKKFGVDLAKITVNLALLKRLSGKALFTPLLKGFTNLVKVIGTSKLVLLGWIGALLLLFEGMNRYSTLVRENIYKTQEQAKTYKELSIAIKEAADAYSGISKSSQFTDEQLGFLKEKIEELSKSLKKASEVDLVKKTWFGLGAVVDEQALKQLENTRKFLMDLVNFYSKLKREKEIGAPTYKAEITPDLEKQLKLLEKSFKYFEMQTMGYSDIEVAQQKLNDYITVEVEARNKIIRLAKENGDESAKNLEYIKKEQVMTELLAGNYVKIKELLGYNEEQEKKILEMKKLQLEVVKKQQAAIRKYASDLKNTFQQSLSSLLQDKIDISGFFDNLRNKLSSLYADVITKNITNVLEKQTGIFGELGKMFAGLEFKGTLGEPIIKAGDITAKKFYNAIVSAGNRVTGGKGFAPVGGTTAYPTYGGGYTFPFMGATGGGGFRFPSWFPFNRYLNYGGYQNATIQAMGARMGYPTTMPGGSFLGALFPHLFTGITTGNWGMAGMGLASMALSAINPVLGLVPMLFGGLFSKRKVVRQSSWTPQEAKDLLPYLGISPAPMPSKIYTLPSSYYFVSNITVHVDKIQGERPDIVNEIAENVKTTMQEKVAQNYYHSLLRAIRPKTIGF